MSTLKRFSRGRGRRYWVVGATLVAAAMFGVTFVASSGAAGSPCPIPGNFEIDGDMNQGTCTPPADDWDTSGIGVQSTTQGGTYSTSGKDDADPTTWTSSGATPNKTDFAQAYATSRVVNGHFFVFVAWERSDTTGTQGYAIEVTNAGSTTGSDGTPQPSRGSGGAVFYLSSQGASAPQFDSACSYTSQSNYGQTCTNSDASVTAAINTAQISDPLNGTDQPAGGFFEVALDVTGLTGVVPSCPGAAANAVYLRSITGQTSNGNLKGYMAPLDVAPNSTCVLPTISTTATPGGSVNATGSAQHDDATVGDGTNFGVGSVKFFLCSPAEVSANGGDCSADGTQVGAAKILDANGNASSDGISGQTTPNDSEAGKYCWRAEFTPSANDHHFLAGSHTNSTSECFSVQASPSIVTTPSETSGSVGDLLNDSATLSDGSNFDGTGSITFSLYGPNDPNCDGVPAYTETVPADHNGSDYGTSNALVTANEAGTWNWTADFSSDSNNNATSSGCGEESVAIVASPSIATTPSETSGSVGDLLNDTATMSGGSNYTGDGTILFSLYGPNDPNCDKEPAYIETVHNINADGEYSTSNVSVTAGEAGTWNWTADFSGDDNNKATSSGCGEESVAIVASPSIVTTPSETSGSVGDLLNDSATLSDGSNFTGDGTIKFSLYGPNDPTCDGEPAYTETVPADHNGSDYVTSNDSVIADEAGTWNWTASFSGDDNNHSAFSECGEESVVIHGAAIHIAKTADAAKVNVGSGIGFTMTVYNSGDGDARGVQLSDTLPTNAGLSWSIASQGAGWNGSCAISAGVLSCGPATVPAGTTQAASTFTVHIVSGTTAATGGDCPGSGTVDNTGNVTASNDGSDHSSASTCVQALVDLSVTKSGSPNPLTLGEGNITWTIVVTNNGPDADTGVTIADPMPAGNTFVSATSSKGSCTGGAILNCSIGAMAAGESVTITLITTPSTTGNQVNTVTVAGDRPETNTGNNSASATVLVVGPATPPVFCVAVSKVTPKQLFVGRKTTLTIRLTQDGKAVKGVHVRIKGPKLNLRTGASNSKGVITQRVKMKKAGILVFSPLASKRCNTKRLGVTNVFTPPVTG